MRMTPVRVTTLWQLVQGCAVALLVVAALRLSAPMPDHCSLCDQMPWPALCRLINWCW